MRLPIFQVDAFADLLFRGNPAAVVPLEEWLPDSLMQSIALENNLSETAFFVPTKAGFEIRWFTPKAEVDLCGHATLAAAHVIFNEAGYPKNQLSFGSRSGLLAVTRTDGSLRLDFPADNPRPVEEPMEITKAIGTQPANCFRGKTDYLLVYETEAQISGMTPDFSALKKTSARHHRHSPGKRMRFCEPVFRAGRWHRRRSGDRFSTYHPHALLGRTKRENKLFGKTAFSPGRNIAMHLAGRSGADLRKSLHLPPWGNFCIIILHRGNAKN